MLRCIGAASRASLIYRPRFVTSSSAAVACRSLIAAAAPRRALGAPRRCASSAADAASESTSNHQIVRTLLQYVWPAGKPALRARVVASLALLVGAKLLNIQVPFLFKALADSLEASQRARAAEGSNASDATPLRVLCDSDGGIGVGSSESVAVAASTSAASVAEASGPDASPAAAAVAPIPASDDGVQAARSGGVEASPAPLPAAPVAASAPAPFPPSHRPAWNQQEVLMAIPLSLLLAYGIARTTSAGFAELRNALFASVAQRAIRLVSRDVYRHLFSLDHRFHLERSTGSLQRVMDRGSRSINFVLASLVFNVVPTALEIGLVSAIFASQCGIEYAGVTLATLAGYIAFTVRVTAYRTDIRKELNRLEQRAASISVDGLLNYDAVKACGNEAAEVARYDAALAGLDRESLRTQSSLSALNFGQNLIFSTGLTAAMALASRDILAGTMSLGDLILVNGLLFQLSIPLNFVGMVYRELRQGLVDMAAMFQLLDTRPTIADAPGAPPLFLPLPSGGGVRASEAERGEAGAGSARGIAGGSGAGAAAGGSAAAGAAAGAPLTFEPDVAIRFSDVHFRYAPDRPVLRGLSFTVKRGSTVGVVGPSGCGKSTLVRLLFRFYDASPPPGGGAAGAPGAWPSGIYLHGQDVRGVRLDSLRAALCTVPQDTTLFNASVHDNIAYGVHGGVAARASVEAAARTAALHETIVGWPAGYDTRVGERGLKLSGGEKQRVAVARAVLKGAPLLLCDEATSSLDSATETAVMDALRGASAGRTTLLIAHRLSTVMHADDILVLEGGALAERGTHAGLLAQGGVYAKLWEVQRRLQQLQQQQLLHKDEAQ